MGLRDYEFDVAPELVAALVRGTPGPLLDRAMTHAGNIAEAAETLRERERQARLRDSAAAVEGTVSAALNGVEATVESVNDRGLFDAGRVGGGLPGGPARVGGGLGPSGLGPGRGGRIFGIDEQNTAQRLGIRGRVSFGAVEPSDETEYEASVRVAAKHEISEILDEMERAFADNSRLLDEAEAAYSSGKNALGDALLLAGLDAGDRAEDARRRSSALLVEYYRWWQYDNPDAAPSGGLDTAVDAFNLYMRLRSLGGRGYRERTASTKRTVRVPAIVRAVDPAPDSENGHDRGSQVSYWMFNLVDPSPV